MVGNDEELKGISVYFHEIKLRIRGDTTYKSPKSGLIYETSCLFSLGIEHYPTSTQKAIFIVCTNFESNQMMGSSANSTTYIIDHILITEPYPVQNETEYI